MSYAPKTLTALAAFWKAQGGVPLGIVGNTSHCAGYHLGRDRIYSDCACRPGGVGGVCQPGQYGNDYSVKLARDRAGLSDAASAIDLGKLNGTLSGLRKFSEWLVKQCQAKAPGTRDIREIIYWSTANDRVQRYSGEDGKIHWGPGNGDLSHRTHTHISFYRDSVARDKVSLFAPYFAPAIPDTSTDEAPMPALSTYIPGQVATIKATSNIRTEPKIASGNLIRSLATKETWVVTGWVKGGVDPESGSDLWLCRWNAGKWEYTAKVNASSGPSAPADTTPFDQSDIDAAVIAAVSPLKTALRAIASEASQAAGG